MSDGTGDESTESNSPDGPAAVGVKRGSTRTVLDLADAERFFEVLVDAHDVPEDSAVVYAVPIIDNEAGIENLRAVIEGSPIGQVGSPNA